MTKGPGLTPTFLYYFVATTTIVIFVLSRGVETPIPLVNPAQFSLLCGLLAGAIGAYFNSHDTVELALKNRGALLKKLKDCLASMGYAETSQVEGVTIYERPAPSKFFSGKIFVQIEDKTATIAGRSNRIRALKKRLEG